jgi:hypothetical protein
MPGSPRGSFEVDESPTFQDSIQDGGRQILIVQHFAPRAERFVGGQDRRALLQVTIVRHMEQNVGGILSQSSLPLPADRSNDRWRRESFSATVWYTKVHHPTDSGVLRIRVDAPKLSRGRMAAEKHAILTSLASSPLGFA